MDNHNYYNNFYYSSCKSKGVFRNALVLELYALVHRFDHFSTMKLALNHMFGKHVLLKFFTDSISLYDGNVGKNFSIKMCLLFGLRLHRQSY